MATSPTSLNDDAVRQIRAIDEEFVRRTNAGDAAGMTECLYAEDAVLMPSGMPPIKGKAAIREFWTALIAAGSGDLTLESTQIEVSGDLAYSIGQFKAKMPGGVTEGKFTVVFKKQSDGGFKAIVDMFSPNA